MHHTTPIQQQRGAALVTALSILLVLTILGVSAMSTSALQERMAGNARDAEVAFEAAEFALRQAEAFINGQTNTNAFSATGTNGLYLASSTPAWDDSIVDNWNTTNQYAYPATSFMGLSNQPKYMIQLIDTTIDAPAAQSLESVSYNAQAPPITGSVRVFQITARGYGLSSSSRVMLQSHYGRPM